MKTEIVKIQNRTIKCLVEDDQRYVVIKPICEKLGIDWSAQIEVLKSHPIFNSTIRLIRTTGADGKQREMLCMPLKRFFLWLEGIHPNKVKEESKEELIKFQESICDILFERMKKMDLSTLLSAQLSNI